MVEERNIYLSEHPKVEVAGALSVVNERTGRLKISEFMGMEVSGRILM